MNVLHVITGLDNGGAEGALYRLATGDDVNVHVVAVLMGEGVYGSRFKAAGIPVHAMGMPRGRLTLSGMLALFRLMRNLRPDVVQTWMYHADLIGGIAARLAGVKAVIWGIRGPYNRAITPWSTRLIIRCCALLSGIVPAAIVSNSAYAAEAHAKVGYDARKFVVIVNGYPLDLFRPDADARASIPRVKAPAAGRLIGMIARFDPYKDHDNLLKALARMEAQGICPACLLVGPGMLPSNEPLMRMVEEYGLQDAVQLLGPRDDVPAVMAALDVHVLSSVAESFPNVLAEAMACGTPCVTTDVGDAAVIVGDTGWIVAPADPDALAGAIRAALLAAEDAAGWAERRRACRERVTERFDLPRMVDSYKDLWHRSVQSAAQDNLHA